jgi:hypothetical protein
MLVKPVGDIKLLSAPNSTVKCGVLVFKYRGRPLKCTGYSNSAMKVEVIKGSEVRCNRPAQFIIPLDCGTYGCCEQHLSVLLHPPLERVISVLAESNPEYSYLL